jgi:hypothetical protein
MESNQRTHEYILWVMLAAAGFHIAEEVLMDFPGFAISVGVPCTMHEFDIINMAYVVAGICSAAIGWRAPSLSLSYPALLVANFFFHTGVSFLEGRPNPGVFTSVLLFAPIGILCFVFARRDGVLTLRRALTAIVIGIALQWYPLILIVLRDHFSY